MTACRKCKWHRQYVLGHYCIVGEDDVFNFLTGEMIKESDALQFGVPQEAVACGLKNKGDCPDFILIEEGDNA